MELNKLKMECVKNKAESGDALMMFELARRYADGHGVESDRELAEFWYERAANAGHWFVTVLVGDQYERGIRVSRNCDRAEELYKRAWSAGLVFGAYALGRLYSNFLGFCPAKANIARAIRYLLSAIKNGHMTSVQLVFVLCARGKLGIMGRLIGAPLFVICSPYLVWTMGRGNAYRRWSGWRDFFGEDSRAARRIMNSLSNVSEGED